MSMRATAKNITLTTSSHFLVRELRESETYLADEGWHQVARITRHRVRGGRALIANEGDLARRKTS
jgi:hypothetical protein